MAIEFFTEHLAPGSTAPESLRDGAFQFTQVDRLVEDAHDSRVLRHDLLRDVLCYSGHHKNGRGHTEIAKARQQANAEALFFDPAAACGRDDDVQ